MRAVDKLAQNRTFAITLGAATIVGVFVLLEILLRVGIVNKYIVPLPSQVLFSLERIVMEEKILSRVRETAFEMLRSEEHTSELQSH